MSTSVTIKEFFERDQFARLAGIELVSVSEGQAVARMRVQSLHLNAVGCVQGGAIFTLADLAFGAAVNSRGTVALAINVNITFLKATKAGTLQAAAREISLTPKLGSYTIDVTDENKNLVAIFQGLAYRKSESIDLSGAPA